MSVIFILINKISLYKKDPQYLTLSCVLEIQILFSLSLLTYIVSYYIFVVYE